MELFMNKSVNDTAEIFKALGDATRLKILKLISSKGNNLCVGKIAHTLNISQPAVSQHLKILKNAGLVEADRDGFHIHYQVKKDSLNGYGIKATDLFKSFGDEMIIEEDCRDNKEECDKLNN
jgi:ArsR family transcriptional regulator